MDLGQLAQLAFSEYGALVSFLLVLDGVLIATIRALWIQTKEQSDKYLTVIENNTRVITQLVGRLEDY